MEVLNSAGGWGLKKEFIKKEAMKLFWKTFISGEGDVQQHYRLRQLRGTPWCGNMKCLEVLEDFLCQNK